MLSIRGTQTRGEDIRNQNVMAAQAISNVVKSSLGPVGLDKMMVDSIGDVIVTNDGATILKHLEVEHPAGKVLCELSQLQDEEVGDGTTSVVLVAAELLKHANELVKSGIHATSVISGFILARKEAVNYIAKFLTEKVDTLGKDALINVAKTAISSKILGQDSDFFGKLAAEAVMLIGEVKAKGERPKYNIKSISILKAHGRSAHESELVNGYALNATRAAQGMPTSVKNAKIALLDIDFRKTKLPLGVQVLINDAKKLENIRNREIEITKERIKKILDGGANVLFTTQGIDDLALKLFVEAGVLAARRVKKADLTQIAKVTGGTVIISMADMEGEESFDAKALGQADVVEECKVGDGELIYIRGCKSTSAATIILRGANDFMLDEMERSLHDSMCAVKRVLESKTVVAGGGAVEAALSVYLEDTAETMGSRQQLAFSAFARALLIIPKTLATNGAFDATDIVAQLRAYHHASQRKKDKASWKWTGLDLEHGKVRNNLKAGVLEPSMGKIKMIKFATEAAITILRIDDSLKMAPRPEPKHPHEEDED